MKDKTGKRLGFTIIELLVVIAIMAVIATLATGAALKSIRQSRSKRVDATVQALEMSLVNYRALHGKWPYTFADRKTNREKQVVGGEENAQVFRDVLEDVKNGNALLDPSALLTRVGGKRMTVKEAMEKGKETIPIGYINPDNTDDFKFFSVEYNFLTQSIHVRR